MVPHVSARVLGRIRLIVMMFLVAVASVACQTKPVHVPLKPVVVHPKRKVVKPRVVKPKVVDKKAQQLSYNQGIRAYSMENYEKAKSAFQHVVKLGSKTDLGLKALDNLRKVLRVLKTLAELRAK